MKLKKILAGTVAAALAVGSMAVCASAADVTVDMDKLVWGDTEQKGNLRIEFFNAYGPTAVGEKYDASVSPINPDDLKGGTTLSVTFTIAGLPEDMEAHTATLGFADGNWTVQDWDTSIEIKGNGTYTITSAVAKDKDSGDELEINGATVFVIDIKGLATTLGVGDTDKKNELKDNVAAAKAKVTISDVKITVNEPEPTVTTSEEATVTTSGDATTTTAAAGDVNQPTTDKNSPDTGVEGVAVVAGLAVIAAGAVIVAKKRK